MVECFYALKTFGISPESLPIDVDGTVNLDMHKRWLEGRTHTEEAYATIDAALKISHDGTIILYPLANDVLLGRGRPFQEFPGNVHMAEIVDAYREEYESVGKLQKTAISSKVVQLIRESKGGRFLKKDGGRWVEVTDDVARLKASHGFRTKTRRNSLTGEGILPYSRIRLFVDDGNAPSSQVATENSEANNKKPRTVESNSAG
jgi:hypothetical protein